MICYVVSKKNLYRKPPTLCLFLHPSCEAYSESLNADLNTFCDSIKSIAHFKRLLSQELNLMDLNFHAFSAAKVVLIQFDLKRFGNVNCQ
jgi:hypothetical protein